MHDPNPTPDSPIRPAAFELDRRALHRLMLASVGGLVAGSALASCSGGEKPAETPPADTASMLLKEPHVCRGLNTCKGLGAGGKNECAGQGSCASVGSHGCAGSNDCAGQGGCKSMAGRNTCKGKGGCGVPLTHDWDSVRKAFETAMTGAGKSFGPAPAG